MGTGGGGGNVARGVITAGASVGVGVTAESSAIVPTPPTNDPAQSVGEGPDGAGETDDGDGSVTTDVARADTAVASIAGLA